jgi:heptosyltransferase-2
MATPTARFLVLRFSAIGDLILTAPALAALRSACHGPCEIHLLTRAPQRPVAEGFGPLVDRIHTFDRSTVEALPDLRAVGFDYVIDLQSNFRSRRVSRALGLLTFRVDKMNWAKWKLTAGLRTAPIPHIVERYTATCAPFGATLPPLTSSLDPQPSSLPPSWPPLFPTLPATLPPNPQPQPQPQPQSQPFALCLGATHPGKRIPPATLRAVAEGLVAAGHGVVLLGGEAERDLGLAVAQGLEVDNRAGETTLAESAAVLRESRAAVVADTGMMHLAAAVGTRTVAVWGCTRPSLGMAAWRPAPGSVDLLPEGRSPRPCSKLGNRCRYGRPDGPDGCSHRVSPDRILAALLS